MEKNDSKSILNFYNSDVIGKIKIMNDGSGGFNVIILENGVKYRFFSISQGGQDFDQLVIVGDSIYKPSGLDSIKIINSSGKEIWFPFLKP